MNTKKKELKLDLEQSGLKKEKNLQNTFRFGKNMVKITQKILLMSMI